MADVTNRGRVFAWGMWDWGSSAYNAVILTFVFSVYLTDAVGRVRLRHSPLFGQRSRRRAT